MSLQRFSKQIFSRQIFSRMCFALVCFGIGFAYQDAGAQIDGAFIQRPVSERSAATQSDIPDYDSDYAAASRLTDAGDSTPEADARPGEYYFRLGAHAFRTKNYTFAIQMYQVSASWAYKPAEYNIAVMYARGQGVPVDLPRAMAWIALAAERNEKHYVDAREAVYAEVSKEQFEQANTIWRDLKKTYGDDVALRRAKARWAEVRANMTGSRVGSQAGNLIVSIPQPNSGTGGSGNGKSLPVPTKNGKPPPNEKYGGRVGATTASEIVGSQTTDGATAYRQLRETDNPYDPKLDRTAFGTAMVGSPSEIQASDKKQPKTESAEPTKQNQ